MRIAKTAGRQSPLTWQAQGSGTGLSVRDFAARSLVEDGAQILVNLSHDGYFGGPAGAEQHMSAAVLRAIEFRRPLLRATSGGLTVAGDAAGRVRASLAAGEAGILRVAVVPGSGWSPCYRSGDLFAWLTAAAAIAMSIRRESRG